MARVLFATLAVFLGFTIGTAQADLPRTWRTVLAPGEGWQLGCDDQSRGRACLPTVYHFQPEGDEAGPDDLLLAMVFSMSRGNLYIVPWQGTCVDGEIKVDGKTLTDLAKSRNGCVPHGGRPFMYVDYEHNFFDISTLAEGEELEITAVLDSGVEIHKTVPLAGFKEQFERYRALEQSSGGGRGGGRR